MRPATLDEIKITQNDQKINNKITYGPSPFKVIVSTSDGLIIKEKDILVYPTNLNN